VTRRSSKAPDRSSLDLFATSAESVEPVESVECAESVVPVETPEPSPAPEPGPVPEPSPAPEPGPVAKPARTRSRPASPASTQLPEPVLADEDQRDLIRGSLDETLVVEASAGTGKTTELVRRMIAVLEAGLTELDRMVAVTFTDAAAGELKLRLRSAIEKARLDPARSAEARDRLLAALPKLEEARIGTIHSFCADLLRERPVEARVDPRFEVAPDHASMPLFERAFARWFEDQLASPGPGVRRILCRWRREPMWGGRRKDEGPRGMLRRAAWQLVGRRDFPAKWRHHEGFARETEIDAILEEMEALAEWGLRGNSEDWFVRSLLDLARHVDEVRRAERVRKRDYDVLEAKLTDWVKGRHWERKGWARARDSEFPQEELRRRRDALRIRLRAFVSESGADLAPRLRDELWPVVDAYEEAKKAAGCLDFEDLLLRARDLIRDHAGVRREMQQRFTHYFVDEFQDTDPLQVEILLLLAAGDPKVTEWHRARAVPGKLFIVGDPKQSIYRFRRADVTLYRQVQEQLLRSGARHVKLSVSFRSVPEIQHAVNAAFAPRMGGAEIGGAAGAAGVRPTGAASGRPAESGGSSYVPLEPFRAGSDSQPAVIALPVPAPYGDYRSIVDWRIDVSLPDVVGAWIHWLVRESGWMVSERERPDHRVPVEPRHVCILFRRFRNFDRDVTRPYVDALEARELPHLLVGGSSFHEREEIEALRNALTAIERPDDEFSLFATLHGPLFALSDAALLLWRDRVGSLHPFRRPPDPLPDALAEVASALALLRDLHRARNRRPLADTIAELLEATRAHAGFAIWPTGSQALANIDRLRDMARRWEQQGLVSFRAFVDRLEDEAERGEAGEAPLLEEGVQGVRIMTVHKAKGLEFPVVVLADMTAKETLEEPTRWSDPERGLCVQRLASCIPPELRDHGMEEMEREREEALRLLYVATTRARDALVVPVIGDERYAGWLQALHPSVYPDISMSRRPETREPSGCPEFGEDSVPARPGDVPRPIMSVVPGLHFPEAGDHRVVWWDPSKLTLGLRSTNGLVQTRILEADTGGRADAALREWKAWREAREETRAKGAVPTRVVRAATEWTRWVVGPGEASVAAADALDRAAAPGIEASAQASGAAAQASGAATLDQKALSAVELIEAPGAARRAKRPRGARFGTLIHALLATVDLADPESIPSHAEVQARLLGATEKERDAAVQAVTAALEHPLFRRAVAASAAAPSSCRRETPLLVKLEDGTLLECVADLAVLDENGWTVVDFKTDAEPGPRLDRYRYQVALYARGIEEATGVKARAVLMKL
jgi:ATP-dependent helicase/nuclease subunit A